MYIEKLQIRNFRAFRETELTLNYPGRDKSPRLANVNLFLGGNGAGKSSVFKAAALAVLSPIISSSGFKAEFLVRRPAVPAATPSKREKTATVTAKLFVDERDIDPLHRQASLSAQATVERTEDFEQIINTAHTNPEAWSAIYRNESPAFFLSCYGASRRTERPEGYSESSRSPRYQRVASLFEEHIGLVPFTFGHLQLNDLNFLDEARSLLNDLLPEETQLVEGTDSQKRPLFDCNGIALPFNALSDGFRGYIGWMWDLLLQIARAQRAPDVQSLPGGSVGATLHKNPESKTLTNLSGVVIVDEIDLFLHPEWQRLVIEQVATTFPNLQFLFSSHSPLVAGTLEPGNIYVLEPDREGGAVVKQYRENIHGLTANQVLTSSYFGLESTRAPGSGTLSDTAARALGHADFASSLIKSADTVTNKTKERGDAKELADRMIAEAAAR